MTTISTQSSSSMRTFSVKTALVLIAQWFGASCAWFVPVGVLTE